MSKNQMMIYLAHGDDAKRKVVAANLELLSHEVGLSTGTPSMLISRCQESPPSVAIVGTGFESDDAFDVLNQLSQQNTCAVIALLESSDIDRSRRLMNDQVMGVLVEPVNESDLRTSIYLARRRFQQTRQMEARIDELQGELDDSHQSTEHGK
ncbi:ANTAR domain-containing response regulator [Planctomycetes bacterium K23_9]|uniref:Response regulatory domain-containing protein n=1 Tax=Stieleria marina TaxID=1930275 RepID=A0A517NXU9_9BACT|nr:hypothetical protein K239x_39560 [Planctomycetes bacterium K23_9]